MKPIEFVQIRYKQIPIKIKDEWKFAPIGRFQWLQRLAWKLLHRFGALNNAYGSREIVTRHVIDPDHFIEKLFKQRQAIVEMLGDEGQTLLVGAEDFSEMMASATLNDRFDFRAEYYSSRRIIGLNVQIIPWMRGMLVMP